MKNIIKYGLTFVLLCIGISQAFSQAKKPTLMIVPSDNWCVENGFTMEFENQGIKEVVPDYKKALQNDGDLLLVISKINGLMADRGFPLKNLETVLKSINQTDALDNARNSKDGGSELAESPVDQILNQAKADIVIQLTYKVNTAGPKNTIVFNMQGLDAYTNKQIATAAGTGKPSMFTDVTVLLEEAVMSHINNFTNSLQNHFDDLFENGREVTIRVLRWDSWDKDLESEFNGESLDFLIENWMAENTKSGRFSTTDATENKMVFEQVRIPLYYELNGKEYAMDTRRFARGLSTYLSKSLNIPNKITTRGLGEATIILGGK